MNISGERPSPGAAMIATPGPINISHQWSGLLCCARGRALSKEKLPDEKAARAMAPEPPPTQPYYESGWCSPQQPPCSDDAGEDTCTDCRLCINHAIPLPRITEKTPKCPNFRHSQLFEPLPCPVFHQLPEWIRHSGQLAVLTAEKPKLRTLESAPTRCRQASQNTPSPPVLL